jgi:antitoxin ParD1/3/4
MNVSLTPELERLVEEQVASGRYKSSSEVVRDALRLLSKRNDLHSARLEALRRDLDIGIAELDRGEGIPGPVAIEQAKAEFRRLTGRAP